LTGRRPDRLLLLLGLDLVEELLLGLRHARLPLLQRDLLGGPPLLLAALLLGLGLGGGVRADRVVRLLVHGLDGVRGYAEFNVAGELLFKGLLILLLYRMNDKSKNFRRYVIYHRKAMVNN